MAAAASTTTTASTNRSTIWIGNLHPRVTEFQLLKLVEPFGRVVRFDFMYSNNERGERLPRGYAFVTFEDYITASEVINKLNGVKLMNRELRVQPSSATASSGPSRASSSGGLATSNLPLSISVNLSETDSSKKSKTTSSKSSISKLTKIRAMEAKLMALSQGEEFRPQVPTTALHQKKPYERPPSKQ